MKLKNTEHSRSEVASHTTIQVKGTSEVDKLSVDEYLSDVTVAHYPSPFRYVLRAELFENDWAIELESWVWL